MSTKKNIFTRILALAMVLCTLLSICAPASAATKSNGTKTCTITVVTKGNYLYPGSESITLSQTKGTCVKEEYNFFTGKSKTKTSKQYGEWDVRVEATDGSHSYSKTLSGSSLKLKLKPNKTYKITVEWDYWDEMGTSFSKGSYKTYPTWKVKKTYKVSSYR